jgi:hypothetical protein
LQGAMEHAENGEEKYRYWSKLCIRVCYPTTHLSVLCKSYPTAHPCDKRYKKFYSILMGHHTYIYIHREAHLIWSTPPQHQTWNNKVKIYHRKQKPKHKVLGYRVWCKPAKL